MPASRVGDDHGIHHTIHHIGFCSCLNTLRGRDGDRRRTRVSTARVGHSKRHRVSILSLEIHGDRCRGLNAWWRTHRHRRSNQVPTSSVAVAVACTPAPEGGDIVTVGAVRYAVPGETMLNPLTLPPVILAVTDGWIPTDN